MYLPLGKLRQKLIDLVINNIELELADFHIQALRLKPFILVLEIFFFFDEIKIFDRVKGELFFFFVLILKYKYYGVCGICA